MSRTLHALRASITVGAFLIAGTTAHAADVAVQRVAMACPHGSDAAGCKPMAVRHTTQAARVMPEAAPVKAAAKAKPASDKSTVDYEHDLWRHQGAS